MNRNINNTQIWNKNNDDWGRNLLNTCMWPIKFDLILLLWVLSYYCESYPITVSPILLLWVLCFTWNKNVSGKQIWYVGTSLCVCVSECVGLEGSPWPWTAATQRKMYFCMCNSATDSFWWKLEGAIFSVGIARITKELITIRECHHDLEFYRCQDSLSMLQFHCHRSTQVSNTKLILYKNVLTKNTSSNHCYRTGLRSTVTGWGLWWVPKAKQFPPPPIRAIIVDPSRVC